MVRRLKTSITDEAGNPLAGLSNTEDWKFTVQDFLAPTYTIVPADGATGVDPTPPQVTITFDEPVYDDGGVPYNAATIMDAIDIMKAKFASFFAFLSAHPIVLLIIGIIAAIIMLKMAWENNWLGIPKKWRKEPINIFRWH